MSDFKPIHMDTSKLTSQIVEIKGHKILTLSGEIDVYSAPQFKQAVMTVLEGTEQHLIIDMYNVRYLDSAGLGILVGALKRLRPDGGTVNLIGCKPTVERILHLTKLSSLILLHKNLEDALAAVSA
jgi:anti-sigma B factor antagonist